MVNGWCSSCSVQWLGFRDNNTSSTSSSRCEAFPILSATWEHRFSVTCIQNDLTMSRIDAELEALKSIYEVWLNMRILLIIQLATHWLTVHLYASCQCILCNLCVKKCSNRLSHCLHSKDRKVWFTFLLHHYVTNALLSLCLMFAGVVIPKP